MRGRKVWPDGTVSSCLQRACARAHIPQLQIANWLQFSAVICKEKFAACNQANFAGDDITAEDIEDELDLATLTLQSNHSVPVSNMAYAGSTGLTMDMLLHRNYHTTKLWQDFFGFGALLQGKCLRPNSDVLSIWTHEDIKQSQQQKMMTYSEANLLMVARHICHKPKLQFHMPGQRAGILAVLSVHQAEQVVIVLGTVSGKTLIFIVGTALANAKMTILIVPLVALQNDLLGCLH